MIIWATGILMALAIGGLMLRAAARPGVVAPADPLDVQVYRDQLREVERDLARGTLTPDEAERVRVEVSRRMLEADRRAQAPAAAERGPHMALFVMILGAFAGALLLYQSLGAPGYPDLPLLDRLAAAETRRANRMSQAEAEARVPDRPAPQIDADSLALIERLRETLADRPDDLTGHRLLARNEAGLGNYAAAAQAQARVIALLGQEVTAQDHADYADLLALAADGYVSPQAVAAARRAIALDPQNGPARYYLGLLEAQIGRPDRAFGIWRALLDSSPPDAPWMQVLRGQIAQAATLAGIRYTPPEPAPGPTPQQVEDAAQLSGADRSAMIEQMVAGLAERLASEGGTAADWARLIRAYGVLGRTEDARTVWSEAQKVFENNTVGLRTLDAAARDAGLLK